MGGILLGRGSGRECPDVSNPRRVGRWCPEERESSSVMGQWEQERSLTALEAAGFKRGQARPLSMGFGERRRLPIGAEKARCRMPRHCQRDATGERSVSLAKIGVVLPRTSCGQRKPVLSCF